MIKTGWWCLDPLWPPVPHTESDHMRFIWYNIMLLYSFISYIYLILGFRSYHMINKYNECNSTLWHDVHQPHCMGHTWKSWSKWCYYMDCMLVIVSWLLGLPCGSVGTFRFLSYPCSDSTASPPSTASPLLAGNAAWQTLLKVEWPSLAATDWTPAKKMEEKNSASASGNWASMWIT